MSTVVFLLEDDWNGKIVDPNEHTLVSTMKGRQIDGTT